MGFEYKYFDDGDATYTVPAWKRIAEKITATNEATDYAAYLSEKTTIKEDEIALRHPTNGSFIRITDEGTIEAFTAYGTGLRIRANHTLQLFGDQIQSIGREVNLLASPNGTPLETAYPLTEEKGLTRSFLSLCADEGLTTYGMEETK